MAPHPLANALLDVGVNLVVPQLKRIINNSAKDHKARPPPQPASSPASSPYPPPNQDAGASSTVNCLNDGAQQSAGRLHNCGTKWQATGVLHCGNLTREGQKVCIKECYTGRLGPEGTHGGSGNSRQRIEFLSWPPSEPGQVHLYQWRYHLEAFDYDYPSSGAFFTFMQLLTRDQRDGPPAIFRLDLVGREVRAQCHYGTPQGQPRGKWAVPLSEFEGKTMDHVLRVKYGQAGYIHYRVTDAETGKVVIEFDMDGIDVAAKATVKCGMYRNTVCGPAAFAVGDFRFKRVA
ncbi:BQ2448_342 [Microbotryum intermedium]|uniref:BQ2448_342 protein n=1 Tax=Microbotryum intermedium TaxID=269621 RepID=A0A238F810_9BASI|nr:BQ2448_342 [Microbotryum intermedium]